MCPSIPNLNLAFGQVKGEASRMMGFGDVVTGAATC